jgi:hypothetical protein
MNQLFFCIALLVLALDPCVAAPPKRNVELTVSPVPGTHDVDVVLTNSGSLPLEINELHLPWGYQTSMGISVAGDPRCEVMQERVALGHPWPVKRYVVIPPGFSVKGTVRVRDRWPEVSTRSADCRDRYAWSYRFQPRNGKPLAALSGEFSF